MDLARDVLLACGRTPAPVESIRDGAPPMIVQVTVPGGVADLVREVTRGEDVGRVAVITAPSLVSEL